MIDAPCIADPVGANPRFFRRKENTRVFCMKYPKRAASHRITVKSSAITSSHDFIGKVALS